MAAPALSPTSATSSITLPETGSSATAAAVASYPYGIYAAPDSSLYDANFINGAIDQVNYTFRKLGGDILDIEITEKNVYAAYEESVLEYSYIVNVHQAKNTLGQALGATTGTFDHDGQHKADSPLNGVSEIGLRFPKFTIGYVKQIGDAVSTEAGGGGTINMYTASVDLIEGQQDYGLQSVVSTQAALSSSFPFYQKVGNKKVTIRRVWYRTPHAMWRFFGYYGGINAIGNLSTYGMYADDSTFEVIPVWQNKLQAMAYEDAIYTRNSHFAYEVKNNKLRIHPQPTSHSPDVMWFEFTVAEDPWDESDSNKQAGVHGVNNMNTLPFANVPYENINSIGKQWIRRFALALSKEMLGQVRGKFSTIPIPGESVTLNASDLLSQAKEEQEKLREELKTVLDELTYPKLLETDVSAMNSANEILKSIPYHIFVG